MFQQNNTSHHKRNKNNRRDSEEQTQIESQLKKLFYQARVGEGHHRDIRELAEEGVDHINVSRNSSMLIGYLLSSRANIQINVLGTEYSSIENLIQFYKTHCQDHSAKFRGADVARMVPQSDSIYPPFSNVYAVVCLGYMSIFKRNPALFASLDQNKLPLDTYTTYNGVRVRPQVASTLLQAISIAHYAFKNKLIPDLSPFILRATLQEWTQIANDNEVPLHVVIAEMFKPETVSKAYLAKQELQNKALKRNEEKEKSKQESALLASDTAKEESSDIGEFKVVTQSAELCVACPERKDCYDTDDVRLETTEQSEVIQDDSKLATQAQLQDWANELKSETKTAN